MAPNCDHKMSSAARLAQLAVQCTYGGYRYYNSYNLGNCCMGPLWRERAWKTLSNMLLTFVNHSKQAGQIHLVTEYACVWVAIYRPARPDRHGQDACRCQLKACVVYTVTSGHTMMRWCMTVYIVNCLRKPHMCSCFLLKTRVVKLSILVVKSPCACHY